ncbi:hypothetical protein [Microseira wollei]|uniref:hypothetical protein n=1 Tax=Microseira wollei TaxID=467598 RepID=UPI001CFD6FF5|nr:hypothetical protein [Microseira wollei]
MLVGLGAVNGHLLSQGAALTSLILVGTEEDYSRSPFQVAPVLPSPLPSHSWCITTPTRILAARALPANRLDCKLQAQRDMPTARKANAG